MSDGRIVHENALAVLDFWFALPTERQFPKDAALDREIGERFGAMRADVVARQAAGWRRDPRCLLAAIVLVDQFSRNIFRDGAEAFAHDVLAQGLTLFATTRKWDRAYTPRERAFLYMPLMHAEDAALQALSVERFMALGDEEHVRYAREHCDVIVRFGRFPSRNAVLGRANTPEEEQYLAAGGGW